LKKLFALKKWLTISEAARHLGIFFGEEVCEADVLRLGLDKELMLSVYFITGASGCCGEMPPLPEAKHLGFAGTDPGWLQAIEFLGNDVRIRYRPEIVTISGIWDLSMLGSEKDDVERRYQELTNGPKVELESMEGPIVRREDGTYCKLMLAFSGDELNGQFKLSTPYNNPQNYYPADHLPADSVLVVRTSALQELEARLSEPEGTLQRPLGRRERDSLLVVIAALARLARIDVAKPSKAAAVIEGETSRMGSRVAARTIEDHLKRIPEALESKGEN
jgi:hypothetical protein